jgi:CHAT domain-containing protein/tetratricopeptide (TPR) repeat protein
VRPSEILEALDDLAERRHRDPPSVLARARDLLAETDDPRVAAAAHRVLGLAFHELDQLPEAVASFRRSVALSVDGGFADREALARAGLAISLLTVGDTARAEEEMAAAAGVAPPAVRGVVELLRGVVAVRTGHLERGMDAYRRALGWLEEVGDECSVARALVCRGVVHSWQGNLERSLDDFAEAERIAVARDLPVLVAMSAHNTGVAYCRRGSLPDALAAFDRAQRAYEALHNPGRLLAVLEADRSEALMVAGLVAEARESAAAAVAALEPLGDVLHLVEARMLLARALLAAGAYDEASCEAARAGREAAAAPPLAAQARYVEVQAEVVALQDQGLPSPDLLRRSQRIATELESQGWLVEALHVRTFVGRIALALGRPAVARAELSQAAAARSRGTADLRARAWLATALLRVAEGDRPGAKRALTRGIAVVDEYRGTLGATELRAHASGHGIDLARLGVSLALDDGRPGEVLRWAERGRAGALRRPAVHPPDDEQLATDLAELRRLRTEAREAAIRGTPPPPALQARVAAAEKSVRNRTRRTADARGRDAWVADTGRVDLVAVRAALGERVLVEYVAHQGVLHAVTVTGRRARLHRLGSVADVDQERRYLLFALRRLLWPRSRQAAESVVASTAARLDDLLLAPLRLPADGPVVVVPTGELHGLPWSALPSLAGRSTTVAPSTALWLGGDGPRSVAGSSGGRGRVALVAGPQLPGADAEVGELSALYPDATVLTGAAATTVGVMAALEEAELVHLAAHGSFRADSPLFSSVLLADGPLTVYDLERLRRAPSVVVLSACEAAVAAVHDGDELLGTAAALLALGVRSVIAPLMPVPDAATIAVMVGLHQRLRAGERPAEALAHAGEGQDTAAAAAFLCIGRDDA